MRNRNIEAVLRSFKDSLNIKVTAETVDSCLFEHPKYPSLFSMSNCLTEWGVKNYGHRVDVKDFIPTNIDYPFVAHLGGKFAMIHGIQDGKVIYSDETQRRSEVSLSLFLKNWEGVALHAETSKESGQPDYSSAVVHGVLKKMLNPSAFLLLILLLFLCFFHNTTTWPVALIKISKLAGVFVTALLLVKSINANSQFVKSICAVGGEDGCNSILNSEASKITSWLSWSEIGFFYFTGSFLALVLYPESIIMLKWLNIMALPYTVYSLSYQYKHKSWCVLCCSVQALLIIEGLIFWVSSSRIFANIEFGFDKIIFLVLSFFLPIVVWAHLKPLFKAKIQLPVIDRQLKHYKYNVKLFYETLRNLPKFSINDQLTPIQIGNPNATNTITLVSNPFCGSCSRAHKEIETLLKRTTNTRFNIVFAVKNRKGDMPTQTARHIISLWLSNNHVLAEKAVHTWFGMTDNDYEKWACNYPVNLLPQADDILTQQKEWCRMVEIAFTPTIFINGHKLPNPYQVEDLKYLLD